MKTLEVKIKVNKITRMKEAKCPFCEYIISLDDSRGKIYEACRHFNDYDDKIAYFRGVRKGVNEPWSWS